MDNKANIKQKICAILATTISFLVCLIFTVIFCSCISVHLRINFPLYESTILAVLAIMMLILSVALFCYDRRYFTKAFQTEILPTAPKCVRISWKLFNICIRLFLGLMVVLTVISFVLDNHNPF